MSTREQELEEALRGVVEAHDVCTAFAWTSGARNRHLSPAILKARITLGAASLDASLVASLKPDFSAKCETCGATPVMPLTGMCGPCTTGEASTAGGKW